MRSTDGIRAAGTGLALTLALCLGTPHVAQADETVYSCGYVANEVFIAYTAVNIQTQAACPGGGLTMAADAVGYKQGQNAMWQAVAPPGLIIVAATIPQGALQSQFVNAGSSGDFGGDFYWSGGASNITPGEAGASFTGLASSGFGFQLVCGKPTCNSPNFSNVAIAQGIILSGSGYIGSHFAELPLGPIAGQRLRSEATLDAARSPAIPSGMCSAERVTQRAALRGILPAQDVAAWHRVHERPPI